MILKMNSKTVLIVFVLIYLNASFSESNKIQKNLEVDEETDDSKISQEDISQQQEEEQEEEEKTPETGDQKQIKITEASCGLNHLTLSVQDRIVNGSEAKIGEFSWQVLLKIENSNRPGQPTLCGGSIINKEFVLTAAHCVTDERNGGSYVKSVEITAGIHNRNFKGTKAQNRFADCVIYHEKWRGFNGGFANDIALLRIPNNNLFDINHDKGGNVNGICLPPNTKPPFDYTGDARVSGWGVTGTNQKSSDILRCTDVKLITDQKCRELSSFPFPIIDSMTCQGIDRKSPCFGDSGGPLVTRIDGRYTQLGIVSTGPQNCGNNKDPNGVYTQVSYFLDWIESTISKNTKNAKCSGRTLTTRP